MDPAHRSREEGDRRAPLPEPRAPPEPGVLTPQGFWTHLPLPRKDKTTPTPAGLTPRGSPPAAPRVSPRLAQSMLPAAMRGLGLVILALLLCPTPAHGLWCQDCTLTTNSSHCTPKQCQPSDTVCASVQITDPSSTRKDHSVNKMCAPSCDFVKRHFFSDYLMGFINSGILKVDVECCEKDLCNGVAAVVGRSTWALAGGLLLSLGSALLWAEP
ncbi:lymphocyte antigen 6H isoform X2 [Heterocephalus glaber]|uniref:Lymphocyte antigen 6H n=1 Tax=Heterocephalus glaber TaxID=10181 RepID=A0AAX6NVI3_HETGA|nr:lymphocyte antigen 6H isoform X2 [Heterocephalus glaber]